MSEKTETTVNEIFELLRNGERHRGVDLLYKYHYNKMYGIAFSIVKKEDFSQDIVHNVIYRLMLLETNKFPSSNELTWLYTVVKNEALMIFRQNKPTVSLEDMIAEPIVEDKAIRDLVDMDAYYSMVKGLNEKQREIVTLKVLGGYTHKEIAKMLGKPIGTIQWIYNSSIKLLKITLASTLVATVLSGVGFVTRLVRYIVKINRKPIFDESVDQTTQIAFDSLIAVFAVLFVCFLILSFVLLLKIKKSNKSR